MMKKIILLIVVFLATQLCFAKASKTPTYQKVRVLANLQELADMAKAGLCVDHGELLPGKFLINVFSESELEKIKDLGLQYEVLIEDMAKHTANQNKNYQKKETKITCANNNRPRYIVPENFSLGSQSGFFTYDEMLSHMDSMHIKYPHLVSERTVANDTIQTIEGRNLYYIKISDNPEMDEEEPEVFYTGLHHAREPLSMQHLIFYMWYLLENYETDEDVKRTVNNVQMYFLPCVNPDGYIYDQSLDDSGGGRWRKNRRDNEDGTFGVDLNRNYGHTWGYDDVGSSPNSGSDTYRGLEAFSEPETQIIKTFCEAHEFLITLNCHTFGNLLIYPWGYDYSIYTPDSAQYVNYARVMTEQNDYKYGTGDQTVRYIVNGDSDDWMYQETELKNKILAMTPESGDRFDGFYPPRAEIIPICKDNIWQNLQAAKLTLGYVEIEDETPTVLAHKNGYLKLNAFRLGIENEAVKVSLHTNDQISGDSQITFEGLDLLEEKLDSIPYTLAENIVAGTLINYDIKVAYEEKTEIYSYQKIYMPQPLLVFEDVFENADQWEGAWGITDERAYESNTAFTDSPNASTEDFANESLSSETKNYIDLTKARAAVLEFNTYWDILARYDYAQISAKSENTTWQPLCGNYTKAGIRSQDVGEPVYDNKSTKWVQESFSLQDFLGDSIKIQFKTAYHFFTENEGFYIDNMKVLIEENLKPVAVDDDLFIYTEESTPVFVLANDSDPENDTLSIQIIQSPNFGTTMFNNDTLLYTPNEGVILEKDTLIYEVCDNFNACDTAMVFFNIDLEAGTLPPTVVNDTLMITSLESTSISVLNNDIDPIGGLLTIEIIEQPAFGTLTIVYDAYDIIDYTLNEDSTNENEDKLTYVACSGNGLCDTAQVVFLLDVVSGIAQPSNFIDGINIYPNPANEVLFIERLAQKGELILYNAKGQAIKSFKTKVGKTEIPIKNLTEGLYYLQFKTTVSQAYMGKFLVVHN